MRFAYLPIATKRPVPSLGGHQQRYRPIIAVLVTGGPVPQLRDGLLDTGADDTVFSDAVAQALGIDLADAEQRTIGLAGRPQPLLCRYAAVRLRITDGSELLEWPATVGFVNARLHYALLGQAGFLQYFSADFDGAAHAVTLLPNAAFPGHRP